MPRRHHLIQEMKMRPVNRFFLLIAPLAALAACTTLSDKDRALLDAASQNAAAAKQEAAQATGTAREALNAAQAAQGGADKAQATASDAAASAAKAAQSAAQSAADAKATKEKADRIFQRSLRKS
jgi:hypothetical protein